MCLDLEVLFLHWVDLHKEAVQDSAMECRMKPVRGFVGSLWIRPLGCLNAALNFALNGTCA